MYTYVALWVCLPKKWKKKIKWNKWYLAQNKNQFYIFYLFCRGFFGFPKLHFKKNKIWRKSLCSNLPFKKNHDEFEYLNEIFQQSFTRSISPAGPWWCNESTRSRTHNSLLNFFWIEIIYNFMCPWWKLCRKLVPGLFLYL